MSTDEAGAAPEILTPRQRRHPITLPTDPSEEELARNWTLSEADKAEILRSRGDDHRRRFALQLLVLRKYGRFLDDYGLVHGRLIAHVSRQLGLDAVLLLAAPPRGATETAYEDRIREYLGYRSFDARTQEELERWLLERTTEGVVPLELYRRAEEVLRRWKIVLPAPWRLERIVASVAARGQEGLFDAIAGKQTPELCLAIDELLEVPEGDQRSGLIRLKEYPPNATPKAIRQYVDRYRLLDSIGVGQIELGMVGDALVQHLAQLVGRYGARDLKRFAPSKRHAMVTCFLAESRKTVLDHIIEMHDQFLTDLARHSKNAFEKRYREFARRAREARGLLFRAIDVIVDPNRTRATLLTELFLEIPETSLRQAREDCRKFERIEERGYLDALDGHYGNLRKYLPTFLGLPFQSEAGSKSVLEAVDLLKRLDAGEIKELPADLPLAFVPKEWKPFLERKDGTFDRHLWELALAMAVRDGLRSGDLYLPESRQHVSFWNLVYDENRWKDEQGKAYVTLSLPREAEEVFDRIRKQFVETSRQTERGLGSNPFASVENGRLALKKDDALEIPQSVAELRRVIQTSLPKMRIEDILADVDARCGFTRELVPLGGYEPRSEDHYVSLMAALVAHGTNLGIAAMGASAEGVTVDKLQHVTRTCLREETLKAANAAIVNHHHRLPLSEVWGEGTMSSSDAQRAGIVKKSLVASFYPRYFGYYERAVGIYTHVSDQHSVFSTKVISCAPREALWVLDGLLENDTILRLREHTTDTHGYTEHVFGLCFLLGFSFMPRIKDLADQQLYKVDRAAACGRLEALFRGGIDWELIREQWDPLVRVAASLRNRTSPAHVVVQRLASSSPSDRLAKALTQLGRAVKTIHILRYIHDPGYRHRIQLQLNRGEGRHSLVPRLFFARRGEFVTGDLEELMNKASCLSLLSNAVLVANTVAIAECVNRLRETGIEVLDEDLARISPLMHEHVIANGTYRFRRGVTGVETE